MNNQKLATGAKKLASALKYPVCDSAAILGSGWSGVSNLLDFKTVIPYSEIPELGMPGVEGHIGKIGLADLEGKKILIFFGRRHWYEGAGWEPVAFPIRLCAELKIPSILLTNAAGGIRPDLQIGSLMLISDHINAMGANPLHGEHSQEWGPRFPCMTGIYNQSLSEQFEEAARRNGFSLSYGVYLAVSGPSYETPAEIKAFAKLGADAIGMSTVPEAILAHSAGIKVCAVSFISNRAAGYSDFPNHQEVIESAAKAAPSMAATLLDFWRQIK